ncbi:MAG: ankyrin repeat domain-containing protein [Akkermansiaceae bacterium]
MNFAKISLLCLIALCTSSCRKKSETVAKQIQEAGYTMTAEGWFDVIRANDVPVMKTLISGGFDEKTVDADGNSGLHIAAESGNRDAAEYLLNRGFSIDLTNTKGETSLMAATLADRPEMVKWLLRQGADPKIKNKEGFMALMLAVTNNRPKVVEELATYHGEDLDSAVLLASLVGHAEVIDTLTNYGGSVYSRMEDGRTPLMLAAENGHHEAVTMLMDIGASRFASTENGDTAQSLAVGAGHNEIATMIEKGFGGQALALESEEEIAEAMDEYLEEYLPDDPQAGGQVTALAQNDSDQGDSTSVAEGETNTDVLGGDNSGALAVADESGDPAAPATTIQTQTQVAALEPVKNLEGARVSPALKVQSTAISPQETQQTEEIPLVMRRYHQRELPVEFKKVLGSAASLRLAGEEPTEIQIEEGESIPNSRLVVIKVATRMETGKLNNGEPVEVGVVVVEDQDSGQRREWVTGRPASSHDPVALVEDAATGQRYIAKQGQKFSSEDGREFIVNDVRPNQLIIEDAISGEVRTIRLRGPRG